MYVIKDSRRASTPFEYCNKSQALKAVNRTRSEEGKDPFDWVDFDIKGDSLVAVFNEGFDSEYSIAIVPADEPELETLEALDMLVVVYRNAEHGDCIQTTYLYGRDHTLSEIVDLLENEFGADIEVISVVR